MLYLAVWSFSEDRRLNLESRCVHVIEDRRSEDFGKFLLEKAILVVRSHGAVVDVAWKVITSRSLQLATSTRRPWWLRKSASRYPDVSNDVRVLEELDVGRADVAASPTGTVPIGGGGVAGEGARVDAALPCRIADGRGDSPQSTTQLFTATLLLQRQKTMISMTILRRPEQNLKCKEICKYRK